MHKNISVHGQGLNNLGQFYSVRIFRVAFLISWILKTKNVFCHQFVQRNVCFVSANTIFRVNKTQNLRQNDSIKSSKKIHSFYNNNLNKRFSIKHNFSIAVSRSKNVPMFGPPIPAGALFSKNSAFTKFLLTKIINAENAAHRSDKFVSMATRTRQEYLKDLAANYTTQTTIDSGSKFGEFPHQDHHI